MEEAAAFVKSGDNIFFSGNAASQADMMRAVAARKKELKDVKVHHLLLLGEDPFSVDGMEKSFRHTSVFVGKSEREGLAKGKGDYIPAMLSEVPKFYSEKIIPLDVVFAHVSPPDVHGFMSLGVECVASKAAVENGKFVIAQLNDNMPRTHGDTFIHISAVNKIIVHSTPLIELHKPEYTNVEKKIAHYIGQLIEDGATIQIGIGGIPNAVLSELEGKKNIGIHTEMISDGVMEAIEKGIVTNAKKTLHVGKAVATFVLGTKKLYDYVNDNPLFELRPCNYTNNPFIISQNENMVAINSALQIDLSGQVCAESIGKNIYSGFGGQLDFIRGASASKKGKAIIALPSTAKSGTVSRIVSLLEHGAGVVTTRGDVRYVVTEYGIAHLFGKTLQERAKALIDIAHPKFREALERACVWRKR